MEKKPSERLYEIMRALPEGTAAQFARSAKISPRQMANMRSKPVDAGSGRSSRGARIGRHTEGCEKRLKNLTFCGVPVPYSSLVAIVRRFRKEQGMVDRIVRKSEAARLLGVSLTSLWRLESNGSLRAVSVLPGLAGFRESELQAFIESRGRVEPDRSRVAAALASPLHGRAGQKVRSEAREERPAERPAAPPVETVPDKEPGASASLEALEAPVSMHAAPVRCPDCGSEIAAPDSRGVFRCADSDSLGCRFSGRTGRRTP